jgi:hypothetical protein
MGDAESSTDSGDQRLPNSAVLTTAYTFLRLTAAPTLALTIGEVLYLPHSTLWPFLLLLAFQWTVMVVLTAINSIPYTPRTMTIEDDSVVLNLRRRAFVLPPGPFRIPFQKIARVESAIWSPPCVIPDTSNIPGLKVRYRLTRENALILQKAVGQQYRLGHR